MLARLVHSFVASLLLTAPLTHAADFRIHTRVYFGQQSEPVSENSTFFADNKVFDYLGQPAEVTIFDPAAGAFTLLNTQRRLRTSIPLADISQFMATLRQQAQNLGDPFLDFLAAPKFQQEITRSGQALNLTSPFMNYRVGLVPAKNAEVVSQYTEFSNAYAQLNTMTNPASLPPFARMKVNAALAEQQSLPSTVELTITPRKGAGRQPIVYRSEHEIAWRLTDSDRSQLETALADSREFEEVEFAVYSQPPASSQQARDTAQQPRATASDR